MPKTKNPSVELTLLTTGGPLDCTFAPDVLERLLADWRAGAGEQTYPGEVRWGSAKDELTIGELTLQLSALIGYVRKAPKERPRPEAAAMAIGHQSEE